MMMMLVMFVELLLLSGGRYGIVFFGMSSLFGQKRNSAKYAELATISMVCKSIDARISIGSIKLMPNNEIITIA